MNNLPAVYKMLLVSPEPNPSIGSGLVATVELLLLASVVAWFAAHVAKMIIDSRRLGVATRNTMAVCWATVGVSVMMLVHVGTLLSLERVSDWTAVLPHLTVVVLLGAVAIIFILALRAELRACRKYVERARQQQA